MIYYSNCKINIGLNILEKREDGYHNLSTIFYPLNGLRDAIEILPSDIDECQFSGSGLEIDCLPENNLCVRAYNAVRSRYDIGGVKIHLHKLTPFGAGLGGGSANAAVIVKALDSMFDLGMSREEMIEISNELGRDVAFFIENRVALGEGSGDLLTHFPLTLEGYYITVVKPEVSMPTREAFSLIKPNKECFDLSKLLDLPIDKWKNVLVNDFEKPIFERFSVLSEIKQKLYDNGAIYVSMSGSGTAIFAISNEQIDIERFKNYGFCHSQKE